MGLIHPRTGHVYELFHFVDIDEDGNELPCCGAFTTAQVATKREERANFLRLYESDTGYQALVVHYTRGQNKPCPGGLAAGFRFQIDECTRSEIIYGCALAVMYVAEDSLLSKNRRVQSLEGLADVTIRTHFVRPSPIAPAS